MKQVETTVTCLSNFILSCSIDSPYLVIYRGNKDNPVLERIAGFSKWESFVKQTDQKVVVISVLHDE